MDSDGDFAGLLASVTSSVVAVTRSANHLAAEDIEFQRGLTPSFGEKLDRQNARLLSLTQRLLGNASSGSEAVRPRLADAESIDDNWRGIVDVLDSLLERADTTLDEFSGAVKRLSPGREPPPQSPKPSRIATALRLQDIEKPQLSFSHVPTNKDRGPFKTLLESKPHATVSLEDSLHIYQAQDGSQHMTHPYKTEIEQYEYPSFVYTRAEPIQYHPFASTTAAFVDSEEAVEEMLLELKEAKEIAIDLEHHDTRSYIGLVSLMQISTRNKDWIVDTLKPWRRKLQRLNQVFTDPNILKIFHGAHMDTIWLQRDLGLYIVGLFDTHCASRVLKYPGGSLAFLLKKFVNFDAQKQYQTADWRIRPLPAEMFDYARSDTHFLLYIYDNMRNELIDRSSFAVPNKEQDKLYDVQNRSKEVALQTYDYPIYDPQRGLGPGGWYKMLNRTPALLTKEQFCVFRDLHEWRDRVAREQDDSTSYVLANHSLFSIAKEMPTTPAKLFSVAQPLTQTVKLRVDEIVAVIEGAKARAEEGKSMREVMSEVDAYIYGEQVENVAAQWEAAAAPSLTALPAAPCTTSDLSGQKRPRLTVEALRSTWSSFWGSTASSSTRKRSMSTLQPQMVIPLPPLTAEIFATPTTPAPKSAHLRSTSIASTPASTPVTDQSEIITLRAKKRKANELPFADTDGLAGQSDEVAIAPEMSLQQEEKQRRRAERKAAKRARKAAAGAEEEEMDGVVEGEGEGFKPFDYASAPTVLHANAANGVGGKEKRGKEGAGGKKKEPFGFAKGLGDVKGGLGRRQKERAGRSMTFKD